MSRVCQCQKAKFCTRQYISGVFQYRKPNCTPVHICPEFTNTENQTYTSPYMSKVYQFQKAKLYTCPYMSRVYQYRKSNFTPGHTCLEFTNTRKLNVTQAHICLEFTDSENQILPQSIFMYVQSLPIQKTKIYFSPYTCMLRVYQYH